MALSRSRQPAEVLDLLSGFAFARGASAESLERLANMAVCHDYPKRNILFHRGEPATSVYLVVKGKVKLVLTNEEGREVVVNLLHAGDLFGLVPAVDGGPQLATAITAGASRLAKFPGDAFLEWMMRGPETSATLLRILGRRLREAYQRIGEHALLGVKERLWLTLLDIAELEGRQDPGSEEIVFTRPTHEELAQRIGSSREVVTRVLKELLDSEVLQAEGRVIRVSESALVLREDAGE